MKNFKNPFKTSLIVTVEKGERINRSKKELNSMQDLMYNIVQDLLKENIIPEKGDCIFLYSEELGFDTSVMVTGVINTFNPNEKSICFDFDFIEDL